MVVIVEAFLITDCLVIEKVIILDKQPRGAIAFIISGDVRDIIPLLIKGCEGFSSKIGLGVTGTLLVAVSGGRPITGKAKAINWPVSVTISL